MKPILTHKLEGPALPAIAGGVASAVAGKALSGGSGGGGSRSSKPKDVTPTEFVGLRPDVADEIRNLFATGGGPGFAGSTTAPVSGTEQDILARINAATQPSDATTAGQNFLQQLIEGGGINLPGLTDVQGIQGGTPTGQANPFLAQAIEAAQRPLVENFQDIVAPALRAEFTGAGQQIQGQGSSPFQEAAARAQSGLASAMGDIGTNLAFQDFAQRQALGSQEFQQLRDLITSQELTGRQQDLQAQTTERQQQLEGVAQAANIDRQQLEGLLANLEAQALPRLVEQLGVDRGLEEFRRRQDQFLQALQMAAQVSSPTVATVGRTTTPSAFRSEFGGALGGALGQGVATGVGQMFSPSS